MPGPLHVGKGDSCEREAAPLGPDRHRARNTLRIGWGLPLSTAVGVAAPLEQEVVGASGYLRRSLFGMGWLSTYWENLVAAAHSGHGGSDVRGADSGLWTQPGAGSGSPLDRWSTALFTGQLTSSGAEVVWQQALGSLTGPMSELIARLVQRVEVGGRPPEHTAEFLDRLDTPAPPAGAFDRALLTDLAVTSGAGAVAEDIRASTRDGVGLICAATQLSDAFPQDYLVVAAGHAPELRGWQGEVPASPETQSPRPDDHFRPPSPAPGFRI